MAKYNQDTQEDLPGESDFANRIKSLRQARQWTLELVAENSDLSISTLSKIENGQMSASFDSLKKSPMLII